MTLTIIAACGFVQTGQVVAIKKINFENAAEVSSLCRYRSNGLLEVSSA